MAFECQDLVLRGKTMRLLCEVELNHIFVLQYNVAQARDH
jgi:hypothetical protein